MSPEDAAAVVQKLRESGTEFRLAENGTGVLVPSARVAELRLQMAGAGLPKTGRVGFELFDKTNFGATDFAEHINYRRAVEGELERSVMALAEVEQARVHVTFPKDSVFLESRQPAKASIMVKLRPGAKLAPANVHGGLPPGGERRGRPDARVHLGARHERQPSQPAAEGNDGRRAALRGRAGVSPADREGPGHEDQLHARPAARTGQVPRRGLGGVRLHGRRAERGDASTPRGP